MTLIACPDCAQLVSDAAAACIHCGRPIRPASRAAKSRSRFWLSSYTSRITQAGLALAIASDGAVLALLITLAPDPERATAMRFFTVFLVSQALLFLTFAGFVVWVYSSFSALRGDLLPSASLRPLLYSLGFLVPLLNVFIAYPVLKELALLVSRAQGVDREPLLKKVQAAVTFAAIYFFVAFSATRILRNAPRNRMDLFINLEIAVTITYVVIIAAQVTALVMLRDFTHAMSRSPTPTASAA